MNLIYFQIFSESWKNENVIGMIQIYNWTIIIYTIFVPNHFLDK